MALESSVPTAIPPPPLPAHSPDLVKASVKHTVAKERSSFLPAPNGIFWALSWRATNPYAKRRGSGATATAKSQQQQQQPPPPPSLLEGCENKAVRLPQRQNDILRSSLARE
uniref:Uncharacterized protein n=1 Tax=Sphaerodactylus townsendi TaxID=933632 RepID=A0ACB8FWH7_9SAUR